MVATLPQKPRPFKLKRGQKVSGGLVKTTLKSPSGDARLWAVRAMKKLEGKGRVKLLEHHLFSDPSARVRASRAPRCASRVPSRRARC